MNALRLLPVIVSFLLLAAHFSRNDVTLLAVISLGLPFLLLVRRRWVPRLFQILLVLAGLEWVRSTVTYVFRRQAAGESWIRLAAILGAVALFTACSGLVFRNQRLLRRYLPE
jgi:apolipoprotein N-acyltransferase